MRNELSAQIETLLSAPSFHLSPCNTRHTESIHEASEVDFMPAMSSTRCCVGLQNTYTLISPLGVAVLIVHLLYVGALDRSLGRNGIAGRGFGQTAHDAVGYVLVGRGGQHEHERIDVVLDILAHLDASVDTRRRTHALLRGQ